MLKYLKNSLSQSVRATLEFQYYLFVQPAKPILKIKIPFLVETFLDKKCALFFLLLNLALNVSKSVKYWCKCIHLAKINSLLHEQCARGCKRMMLKSKLTLRFECTFLKKITLTIFDLRTDFLLILHIHKEGRQPYLF